MNKQRPKGRVLIALDEVSWIGSKDPDFLGQLKNAWDLLFSRNPRLVLIVCGSVSSWIEKNILSGTGFVGRISLNLKLEELPLSQVSPFWGASAEHISAYEMLKVLSVTGGVPRYLEEIQPTFSAEENIRNLCFDQSGLLFDEFHRIFSDLFSSRAPIYTSVVQALSTGSQTLEEIAHITGKATSTVGPYLQDLIHAGFVSMDPTWNLKTMQSARLRKFRLSDNYLRFYLRYIQPNRERILEGEFEEADLHSLPQWETMMGLQFENLVLRNIKLILKALHLSLSDIVRRGPYFQRPTKRLPGCQIDLMIQSRYNSLYLCEIKFCLGKVGLPAAREIQKKRKHFSLPRGWSTRLVLIHVNGITGEVLGGEIFDHIIDFSTLIG